jgi:hypothetical protein
MGITAKLLQHIYGTYVGHTAIQQQQIKRFGACSVQRRPAIGAQSHARAQLLQGVSQEAPAGCVVVRHQHVGSYSFSG